MTNYKKEADKLKKPSLEEILNNLKVQQRDHHQQCMEHKKQYEFHLKMSEKAENGVELITQLIKQEEEK